MQGAPGPSPAHTPLTPAGNASGPARAPGALAIAALAGVALLGNGLKAIISSSVLVSEAQFASYLGMTPERVAVLLESIIAGMVIALAACPLLLQHCSARALAMAASAAAAAAFCVFALVDLAGAPPIVRDWSAFACFALGAGMLALLAPSAQALVALAPTRASRTTLTALWTGATPAGFLVAPQMVKFLLPVLGLGYYFLAFSLLPLALLLLLGVLAIAMPAARGAGITVAPAQRRVLLWFVVAVLAFEVWTTLGSLVGYRSAAAVAGLAALAAATLGLVRAGRAGRAPGAAPLVRGAPAWLLGALFVLEMPTTGFFDTAYLNRHGLPQDLIANRATLGAAAQICATVMAGWLIHRWPAAQARLLFIFGAAAVAGVAAIASYPWTNSHLLFIGAPALQGFGAAGVTVLVCLAVVRAADVSPLLATLPSLAIMLGTEFGLEILQLVFAAAQASGLPAQGAYQVLFATQILLALGVLVLLAVAVRPPPAATPPDVTA
jgi:hypothetical protein